MDAVSFKRENYLEWQEYFMSIAFLSAQRSKDPRTQVGAVIVNKDKKIVGIGYNGMPMGCSDDKMPWNRAENDTKEKWLNSKSPYVCHAELNAVLNKNQADITGCSIYVALFPCNMCAQIIIQSGITEVIYYSDKYHGKPEFVASRFLLDTAGVKYRQFKPRQKTITIDFELIESTAGANPTLPVLPVTGSACDIKDGKKNISQTVNDFISSTEENICNSAIDKAVIDCGSDGAVNMKRRLNKASFKDLDVNNSFTGRDAAVKNLMDKKHGVGTNQDFNPVSELSVMEVRYALFSIFFIVFLVLFTWFIAKNV